MKSGKEQGDVPQRAHAPQQRSNKQAYLLDYGVAVVTRTETGAFKSDSRITAADIR